MFSIINKVGLITGGLGGIGLGIAKELLRNGLKAIVLLDVNESNSKDILKDIENEFGEGRAIFLKVDIIKEEDVEGAFQKTVGKFKHIDIVINCAGIADGDPWERIFAVNLTASYRIMLLALEKYFPSFKTGEEGLIINIASTVGLDPTHTMPCYSTTKGGIVTMTRCFGTDYFYDKYKGKVLAVCPGYTKTPLTERTMAGDDAASRELRRLTATLTAQTTEELAKCFCSVVSEGENGSIWVIEGNSAYEVEFLERTQMKKINK